MDRRDGMALRTRLNWLLDAIVFMGGTFASFTGLYFLFAPSGGFQGGRNPGYGLRIIFERGTWDDLHTWGGILMIAAATIHFAYHWPWVTMMAKRMVGAMRSRGVRMSVGAKINLIVDALLALSFFFAAVSGVYFLFAPAGGFQGGTNPAWDPNFLMDRTTWDLIHTWSGVVMIVAAVIHFAIHWRWVVKVTLRFFQHVSQTGRASQASAKSV